MSWARIMAPLSPAARPIRRVLAAAAAAGRAVRGGTGRRLRPRRCRRPDALDGRRLHGRRPGHRRAEPEGGGRGGRTRGAPRPATPSATPQERSPPCSSPVWAALSMEGRLSDVVVFDDGAAKGKGPLAESFQQIVADEQRPTLVARRRPQRRRRRRRGLGRRQGGQPRGAHGAAAAAEGRPRW